MRGNADDLPALYELTVGVGAAGWELFFLVPTGRGAGLAGEELYPLEQERVLRWLYDLQRESTIPVKQICAPHFRRVETQVAHDRGERRPQRVTRRLTVRSRGCLSGNGFCFVSHVGDVCGCGFLPLSVGNVRDHGFTALYREAPLFEAFRDPDRLGGACGACEYRSLCGGCRARAYAATGDPLAEEPDCAYEPAGIRRELPIAAGAAAARPEE
jgi:radical SAM protein with 4Fe4S-binding SPASM domain